MARGDVSVSLLRNRALAVMVVRSFLDDFMVFYMDQHPTLVGMSVDIKLRSKHLG